ncbi:RNA polymerase sigma factor SigK OS=Kitasatospora aureofaciens OX=1894 GN=GCM10010502_54020 PE=3 SV=1 [Kitasatospora aureofaciens]|nr:RNA polymerase subunit sigma [Kitasatospora aureofaciens]
MPSDWWCPLFDPGGSHAQLPALGQAADTASVRPCHRLGEDAPVNSVVHLSSPRFRGPDLKDLVAKTAFGDQEAFSRLYDAVAGPVLGLVRRVLRDPAQSEEVTQEVMFELWRTASRYEPQRGEVLPWVLTMAHRRAVDRVRAAQASADRDQRAAARSHTPAFDEVAEQVENRLEREQVRRCLEALTELQRESVTLAYYRGYTYPEVAELLGTPLGTVKTRMRDGLIRLRDCLGVGS